MKKWTIILVALLFTGMIFWSCSGDDDGTTEPANVAPTCEITSPANNATYTIGDTILVQVNADDEDGSIGEVRFYLDSLEIGAYTDSAYSHILITNTLSLGLHTILVEAEDNEGLEITDEIIFNLNNPPICQISEPVNNSIFEIGDIVSIVVDASDSNKFSKSIANVEFYVDDILLNTDTDLPYSYEWNTTSYSSGDHAIKVITEDNDGAETESQINIALEIPNSPPVVDSLIATPTTVFKNEVSTITCFASDQEEDILSYNWGSTYGAISGSGTSISWTAPNTTGIYTIICSVNDVEGVAIDSIKVIVENNPPLILSLTADTLFVELDKSTNIICLASDMDGDSLTYTWETTGGSISSTIDESRIVWWAPLLLGTYTVTCAVSDGEVTVTDSITLEATLTYVQGGTFEMGDHYNEGFDWELPVHSITLGDYYIGKYEVLQPEWEKYMPPSTYDFGEGEFYPVYYINWYEILVYCNKRSIAEGLDPCYTIDGSTNPDDWGVIPTEEINSTWDAAICNWNVNGYRLPTEAEWEYAARGGVHWVDNLRYSGCQTEAQLWFYAWYDDNSSQVHVRGGQKPNQLELLNMSGNVMEWCWDWYDKDYYTTCNDLGVVIDPKGPSSVVDLRRVGRGGAWFLTASFCRVSHRTQSFPYHGNIYGSGFRLVRSHY